MTDEEAKTAPEERKIGVGRVVSAAAPADDLALPPVVEFRRVTKTYNVGQYDAFTAIRDVTGKYRYPPGRMAAGPG